MERVIAKTRMTLEMIKFSHSVFALPFALASMFVAARGWPGPRTVALVVAAMVTARCAAMAFNRIADAEIDARNPRTKTRHIPAGLLGKKFVAGFTVVCSLLFFAVCSQINPLSFALSPVALAVLLGYSYSKRFTWLAQFWLGLSLGMAPIAAWIAVTGEIQATSVWLGLAVLFWVAGFDILYATQDYDFDRISGLHSLGARFGIKKSLNIAKLCHIFTVLLLVVFGAAAGFSWRYLILVGLIGLAFVWEHVLVKPEDLSRINAAFFTANGLVSLGFLAGILILLFSSNFF